MTHPMLNHAIAQAYLDDLHRDLRHRSQQQAARSAEPAALPLPSRSPRVRRFARFAATRRARAATV